MKRRIVVVLLVTGLVLSAFIVPTAFSTSDSLQSGPFEVVRMNPDAEQTLKAQGKSLDYPFPNMNNNGRKFNPSTLDLEPLVSPEGDQPVIAIFVQFTNPPPGGPSTRIDLSYFDNMLYGKIYDPPEYAPYVGHPTDRTLRNYWEEVSYGKIFVTTHNMPSTLGWANSGHTYGYYCKADGTHNYGWGLYPQNAQGLVIDAIKAVDDQVDFSQYAVNGEVPNLFVVHAGTGAEWSTDPSLIWSHSWDLSSGTGLDGFTVDGVKINKYAMMPEVGGDLTGYTGRISGSFPPTCGVYAHEFAHVLGLPDQYDYGYESEGTGMYSLMAAGSWGLYPYYAIFSGNSPAQIDAWSKIRLGLVTPKQIEATTVLPPVETDPVVYRVDVPNSGGKEYFLLENRQQIGFDQSLKVYSVHGLAVYHVDETVFVRNYWQPNEAENWKEYRSEGWQKADNGETHYAISLIQADDQWHLEHGTSVADSGDLYPGKFFVTSLSSVTKPNTSAYYFWKETIPKFGYSGVTIANIQETSGVITAELLMTK